VFIRLTATSRRCGHADRVPGRADRRQAQPRSRTLRRSWRPSTPNGCSSSRPTPWSSATRSADRVAAAARHLAGRHPRRPDRPHPAAHRRSRVDPRRP
jgi:hypothetical protein